MKLLYLITFLGGKKEMGIKVFIHFSKSYFLKQLVDNHQNSMDNKKKQVTKNPILKITIKNH